VHCAPGDSTVFAKLAPRLAEHGHVVLVDLPDARSSPEALSLDPDDTVADLKNVVSALAPASVTLVGVSFGAWVAARYASQRPAAHLVRLVLLAGCAGLPPAIGATYRELVSAIEAGHMTLESLWAALVQGCFPTDDPPSRAIAEAMVAPIARERTLRWLRRVAMLEKPEYRIGTFDVPAFALHGRDDGVLPFSCSEELVACGTRASLRSLTTDKHLLPLTHVDECLDAITM
jgi:pimeloyl-ACP methyl ester carboxylesterase